MLNAELPVKGSFGCKKPNLEIIMVIQYFATLRDITKLREENWLTHEGTLEELIASLNKKYGAPFRKWTSFDSDGFGSLSIFLINGKDYRSLKGLKTQLKADDTISIFPPIAGG